MLPTKRKKKSNLWNSFHKIDQKYAKCNECSAKFSYKSTITNLKKHMERKHPTASVNNTDAIPEYCIEICDTNSDLLADKHDLHEENPQSESEPSTSTRMITIKIPPSLAATNSTANVKEELETQSEEGSLTSVHNGLPTKTRKTSDVWNFFNVIDKKYANCNECSAKLSYKTTITNLRKHMLNKHPTVSLNDIDTTTEYCMEISDINSDPLADEDEHESHEENPQSEPSTSTRIITIRRPPSLPATLSTANVKQQPEEQPEEGSFATSVHNGLPTKSRRKSDVWNSFNAIDKNYAKCNECSAKLSFKTTISNLKKHIQRKHPTVSLRTIETTPEYCIVICDTDSDPLTAEQDLHEENPQSESEPSTSRRVITIRRAALAAAPTTTANVKQQLEAQSEGGSSSTSVHVRGHCRASSDSSQFIEATKRDALNLLRVEFNELIRSSEPHKEEQFKKELDGFTKLFRRFLDETGPSVNWDKIEKLPSNAVRDYDTLKTPTDDLLHQMLNKLVVIKLNGGLGTSMGCHGPKSVITVRNNLTFLDLTVQQIENLNKTYNVNVPLVLMNSFNTDDDTEKIIRKYKNIGVQILTFSQSCYPRINKDSLMPIATSGNVGKDVEAWYPPGHGDFYESFKNSGLLKQLLDEKREYCFISNIDNLGATVDENILNLLLNPNDSSRPEFVMEVTDKTRADVKGGTLIQYEGKLRLLEIAQVPKEHVDDFKSIKTFKFFNTNNLWIKLDAIQRVLDEDLLKMEIITNNKSLERGVNVIQLETAVGAAMKSFEDGIGINVPRSRFLPVKKTSDLFLVMSNLYTLQNGSLIMSPQRMFPTTPFIKLGDNHFSKVKEFLGRFSTIPDILELDHLTVSGDVTFGKGVSLKGTVIIIANHGDRIDIPACALLENKIVAGNMRILDH